MRRALLLLLALLPAFALADEQAWRALKEGGYVVLIRHASTVAGTGDPPGFRVEECSTQRNLSAAGREEARRLGAAFRARAIPVGQVRSSRWCRCLETARLAFGQAQPWSALDSLYNDALREAALVAEVHRAAAGLRPPGNMVLVTHAFNIRALTGVSPRQSEIIVTRLEGGQLKPVGRIAPP